MMQLLSFIKNKFPACIYFVMISTNTAYAQHPDLYEHTTLLEPYITRYQQDVRAVNYFYGPMSENRWNQSQATLSPDQNERLKKINQASLNTLQKINFSSLNTNGQVDYILLKRKIEKSQEELLNARQSYDRLQSYYPFAQEILDFEKTRRRGATINGQLVAATLDKLAGEVKIAQTKAASGTPIPYQDANFIAGFIHSLKQRLKSVYDFYKGYDPEFTWWVPEPYKKLNEALESYQQEIKSKSDWKVYNDGSNIGGAPIGKKELEKQLKEEMIAYSPEELLKLADQEFAWCEKEMLKASGEMGFGKNWKAALEKVKNSYVPAGHQPELIMKLYNDSKQFIEKNELLDFPPLADETWGMIMMTPERQLVNPFFTGGREISISYPTNDMSHEDKLMSMRGNNPYFSRATVQHELIPGHHLQYYMNSRYKPYRTAIFNTPFWTEGWALYWELLLYSKGFAQTPEERIGMLFWRMHRCARITFSIKFHLGEWTPQQCVDYLVDKVGHERANAHGEVKRSFEGAYGPLYQLAYLVGGLQLMSLKNELVDSGKMSFKQFHDRILKENYLPIEMLRAVLLNQTLTPEYKTNWKFYQFK